MRFPKEIFTEDFLQEKRVLGMFKYTKKKGGVF